MTIQLSMLVPHTPRMIFPDKAPEFQKDLVNGMHKAAKDIENVQADVVVIVSTHWQSTFESFVDATPQHNGVLTAFECPHLIKDVPYHYPGDERLATQLVEAGKAAGITVVGINDPTYVWDYGTVVPIRYLVPKEDIPVIDLSICLAADLEETFKWGRAIGKVLRESEKRVVFVSSGALAHNLKRGPEIMPTLSEQALDNQFLNYVLNNQLSSAWEMLPQYARNAGVEGGGRHLAMLLGVMEGSYASQYYGYGQSSGSGNVVVTFQPQ